MIAPVVQYKSFVAENNNGISALLFVIYVSAKQALAMNNLKTLLGLIYIFYSPFIERN